MKALSPKHAQTIAEFSKWDGCEDSSHSTNLITKGDMSEVDMSGLKMSHMRFQMCDFTNAKLKQANLYCASMSWCNLSGAKLDHSQLQQTHLYNVNLSHADLWGADLNSAKLSNCDLSNARFCNVDMRNTKGIYCHTMIGFNNCFVWSKDNVPHWTIGSYSGVLGVDKDIHHGVEYQLWLDMAERVAAHKGLLS